MKENKTEYKIKTLRTDRGDEFLSTKFTQFYENEGMERHLTTPYTPQQNGVVEHRNCTIMAMARPLLKGTYMPTRFWGEVVRHAVYLLNCPPTKALEERTPFEAWMGRKPHLAHLRVFDCVAYVKNTAPHLKKLDDRSLPMVYLGVEEGANNEEKVPEFMVVDAFGTDEVIVATDIEATVEDVTTLIVAVVPMTGASSPSTPSLNTHTASSPSITNSPESYEGPVCFRFIDDIYANTEEVVGIDEEEGEKQKIVALSSCEAEFMAAATTTCHALWLRSLASELTGVEPKSIVVEFVNTGEQRANALTKALPGVKLAAMRQLFGVRDLQLSVDDRDAAEQVGGPALGEIRHHDRAAEGRFATYPKFVNGHGGADEEIAVVERGLMLIVARFACDLGTQTSLN
ncbi:hypothetical protein ZIOFF_062006 [Zingiber officinale]|uniref:Integrase catalytic domain-containing protein n=1 Tax=Zingiber officinale TaxID=94328 RepID=A0A8J5F063_ZINOF|nr:hypothetical protein ZIOFF_062006 [Zingiber officinale]